MIPIGGDSHALYVGTTPDVNLGVVTTDKNHLGGGTEAIGYSFAATVSSGPVNTDDYPMLFVGTTPNVNAGVVTTSEDHNGGATSMIGYCARMAASGASTQLFVGLDADCNAGIVSTDPNFRGGRMMILGSLASASMFVPGHGLDLPSEIDVPIPIPVPKRIDPSGHHPRDEGGQSDG